MMNFCFTRSDFTLDSHEEHHRSHDMNLQKIMALMALMALYLWTHGAKKGAMMCYGTCAPNSRHSGHLAKGSKGIQGAASESPLEISG